MPPKNIKGKGNALAKPMNIDAEQRDPLPRNKANKEPEDEQTSNAIGENKQMDRMYQKDELFSHKAKPQPFGQAQ